MQVNFKGSYSQVHKMIKDFANQNEPKVVSQNSTESSDNYDHNLAIKLYRILNNLSSMFENPAFFANSCTKDTIKRLLMKCRGREYFQ